ASCDIYSFYLLEQLRALKIFVDLIITDAGKLVWEHELEKSWQLLKSYGDQFYEERDISAPPASGSSDYGAMIIIPCSMGTLAGLATGQSKNLLLRAGDVMLKERKPLILVVRETPLNYVHLQNMLTVTAAGGVIFPAMPGFYTKPETLEDLIKDFIGRILQFLGLSSNQKSWKGLKSP
ncbi:MAG: UbiX family flavin prenyltransferase, partial [Thermodesulfobacteriaceae bacterium]|nr:UbiX family flavin prenyltransferase [Thermodesulfobacteriaceae bacterium]